MQTVSFANLRKGVFLSEQKNRFLCSVQIDKKTVPCYVPSSCHLANFMNLNGKTVLLAPTQAASKTDYSLYAIPYKRKHILLNTSLANTAITANINSRRFSYLGKRKSIKKEYTYNNYKCDLYIEDSNSIIEIKSVISINEPAVFPTVYSERTIEQLNRIEKMLLSGCHIYWFFVSLNPYTRTLLIDKTTPFYSNFKKCVDYGMIVKGYTCFQKEDSLIIGSEIPVSF